jgi:crossover junction endodeoxyribonuclease RuvC
MPRSLRKPALACLVKRTRMPASNRVLAIDPSLRCSGYAVLERAPAGRFRALAYGEVKNAPKLLQSGCLVAIRERIAELIATHQPDCAAVEAIIYVQSFRTAIVMGCARGAALLAAAERGLPIYEYAPRRVKQAIVGRGGAEKGQVGYMVKALVDGLATAPSADAADALAIGMTHFQAELSALRGAAQMERI